MFFVILFLLGLVAGIIFALPYGPVGFVVVRRFYLFGMKSGMLSACGNALSDAFYTVIVGFGLHRISHFLLSVSKYTEIAAGFVLVYLGIHAVLHELELDLDEVERHPLGDIGSAFFLNIFNPALIFAFAFIFSVLFRIIHRVPLGFYGTSAFVVGIFIGTLGFWYLMGKFIHYLRKNNRHSVVQKINYISGFILAFLGAVILISVMVRWF